MNERYDYVILGAGIFGLYAAHRLTQKGCRVCLIEREKAAFTKASYINQARVHNGYHYPRSLGTALKSAEYFARFTKEFDFAIADKFEKIYAISNNFSYTSAEDFKKFCARLGVPCEEMDAGRFFNPGMVEAAFKTLEYSFDAHKIRDYLLGKIEETKLATILYASSPKAAEADRQDYLLTLTSGARVRTPHVINATYSGVNEVINLFGFEPFDLKHERCEITLCKVSPELAAVGITVVDGPFFSLMPFGTSGFHSLSAVSYTPGKVSHGDLPVQEEKTQWESMYQVAKKYLLPSLTCQYDRSLFTTKTVLRVAELDDARHTIIKRHSEAPALTSIFSGKISSIFDLDRALL